MKKAIFSLGLIIMLFCVGCKKDEEIVVPQINFNPQIAYDSMTDQDGNTYKTVTIGTQVWMAENLRTTRYRNGSLIPEVNEAKQWQHTAYGARCKYDNEQVYVKIYGCLYNWLAVHDNMNILAPEGWHVPGSDEYTTLVDYLGGWEGVAKVLMESGKAHWNFPGNVNTDATNQSGFTALPGGELYFGYNFLSEKMDPPAFMNLSCVGCWWTTTTESALGQGYSCSDCANCFVITYSSTYAYLTDGNIAHGHSVRCIKD